MTDSELQHRVLDALELEPGIDATRLGVSATGGVVTLRGDVPTYREREVAERVALRVPRVTAVANDIRVTLATGSERSDADVAAMVAAALRCNASVSGAPITVSVRDGHVILRGTVTWHFQKEAAARALRDLVGVRGITNHVAVEPRPRSDEVRATIEAAFARSAGVDARRVTVSVSDGIVTLSGNVRSPLERLDAERAAWAAPGVTAVDDRLAIVP